MAERINQIERSISRTLRRKIYRMLDVADADGVAVLVIVDLAPGEAIASGMLMVTGNDIQSEETRAETPTPMSTSATTPDTPNQEPEDIMPTPTPDILTGISATPGTAACGFDCHYTLPYGFVPEADCPVHDKGKVVTSINRALSNLASEVFKRPVVIGPVEEVAG